MDPQTLKRYLPPDLSLWKGRVDGPNALRYHEVIRCIDLQTTPLPSGEEQKTIPHYAIVGFASDAGVARNQGRSGAAEGPQAFRKALAKLPFPAHSLVFYDVGDITCTDGDLEASQLALGAIIHELHQHRLLPVVIGGGHEVAWGHYQGIATAHPKLDCAIVNFDAHLDLRPLLNETLGTSGTSFRQIANARQQAGLPFDYYCFGVQELALTQELRDQARLLDVKIISAREMNFYDLDNSLSILEEIVRKHDAIYLTVCLDVFAAPFAPGVSAPQPLGLFPWQVIPLIQALADSKKVIGLDIAELSPRHDQENLTANLAAHLVAGFHV